VVAIPSFWDERKLFVFVTLIIVAAVATLLEVDAARNGRQSLADEIASSIFAPLEGALSGAATAIGGELSALANAGKLASDNAQLRDEVHQLSADDDALHAAAVENADLRKLIKLRAAYGASAVAADVVGYSPEAARKEITIDRGWRDGVKRDCVVVGGAGLVGHIIDAGPHEAHVLLIIDPTSSVPAYLQRSRAWGIVVGTSLHVKMKYIGQDKKIIAGDMVVTGRGQVYPGGISIGRVREVDRKDSALYQSAVLDSEIDFASLTHVLVLPLQ
jgi:rod shape-determining protein MreC